MNKFRTIATCLLLSACASDKYLTDPGHAYFAWREYEKAGETFSKSAKVPTTNQVLFLLDSGSAYFAAQNYPAAIEVLLKAETLAEIKDYTSVSEEVGTLVTSDNVRGYKGEDFEKVLINVYLALAYAAQDNMEDALVEARKINQLLYKMIHEGKRNYQESPFARYLSAMLWENSKHPDDAYIDYKACYALDPQFPEIGAHLLGMAKTLKYSEELQDWKKKFPADSEYHLKPNEGEVVLIYEMGQGPVKIPRYDDFSSLPRFVSRVYEDHGAQLRVGEKTFPLENVLDIETLSKNYLEDRIARMRLAKLGGLLTKGALAYGIGRLSKSEGLGWLSFYALLFSDQADLRTWRSLPAKLMMVRVPFVEGTYDLYLDKLGYTSHVYDTKTFSRVKITRGKKVFLLAR